MAIAHERAMSGGLDSRSVANDGRWGNDAGSELVLAQSGAALSGLYRTRLGAAEHGRDYPLVGWRNRRCLGFSVAWGPDSESLTSWTGLIDVMPDRTLMISAMWLLVSGTSLKRDGEQAVIKDSTGWEAFRTQSAVFRRLWDGIRTYAGSDSQPDRQKARAGNRAGLRSTNGRSAGKFAVDDFPVSGGLCQPEALRFTAASRPRSLATS